MKRLLTLVTVFLVAGAVALAASSSVRDLGIRVSLSKDGTATITEVWNVSVSEGTEWYLVRENLGDIKVSGLSVTDETGQVYTDIGDWNVNASRRDKAGKCGIVRKSSGVEICWGLGEYGSHVYTVSYRMSNAVKALDDYDMLHMQFVSPGLSAAPQHVKVTLEAPASLSEDNSRIWGFGFYGSIEYEDGLVVAESDRAFSSNSSVIELIRFDKGIFSPTSVQDKTFQSVLDRALEGSDFAKGYEQYYDDDKGALLGMIVGMALSLLLVFGGATVATRKIRKNILGVTDLKQIQWSRDVPFGGNLMESYWVLKKLGLQKGNTFTTAMILKMIKDGQLASRKDERGNIEITFSESSLVDKLGKSERELYEMMKEASGADVVLQNKEFSRWSKHHTKRVNNWINSANDSSWADLAGDKYVRGYNSLNAEGQEEARKVVGFKQFLSDFTLSSERETRDVALWQDYLIFAALCGIAEKVAKELKDINPQLFEEAVGMDPVSYVHLMRMSDSLANSITNAQTQAQMDAARAHGGYGGHTSFGGGGGFSGGGFGGGAR